MTIQPPKRVCRPALNAVSGFALMAVLTGCVSLGPEFTPPKVSVAENWVEPDKRLKREENDLKDWWKIFEDPTLDRLIDIARDQNLSLQIAGLRILEGRARLGIATGKSYPQTQSLRSGAAYERSSDNQVDTAGTDSSSWTYDLGFDTAWELDVWGRFRRGVEAADANMQASVADYHDIMISLTAEVARTYVAIRTTEERLRLAEANVSIQRVGLRIAEDRRSDGETSELDVQQARSLLSDTQASIPLLRTQRRQAENALGVLLGQTPDTVRSLLAGPAPIPTAPAEVAVGMPAELLRRRPDVRRAELEAAVQSARIGMAMTDLYPRFSLTGSIGLAASDGTNTTRSGKSGLGQLFDLDSLTVLAGPSFSWNVFNYGRLKNRVRAEDARLQQLLVSYQETVIGAAREVEDAMVGFLRSHERVQYLATSAAATRRAVDISLTQYREGEVSYQRVLDSQGRLVVQQDRWTASQGNVARNLIAMYKALGGGWQPADGAPNMPRHLLDEMQRRTDWGDLLQPVSDQSGS